MSEQGAGREDAEDTFTILVAGKEYALSVRSRIELQIETLGILYKNTKNPVYVWKAIFFYMSDIGVIIQREAAPDWEPWTGVLPDWCRRYLLTCAAAVDSLCLGLHYDNNKLDEDITHSSAATLVPPAFGFTKKGWNAFLEHRSITESIYIDRFYFERREDGASAQQAMNETLERYGFENGRSVRRRLSALNKAYARRDEPETEAGETSG